jgi:beta-glucosidase
MEGPGYDWHFRHALILRQGRIYAAGIEKFRHGAKRVVLLGDETASEKASEWPDAQVFDMGFKGDRTENVLWRLEQRPIAGYRPHVVVVSVGRNNAGINSAEEIAAAKKQIVAEVRQQAPDAEIIVEE